MKDCTKTPTGAMIERGVISKIDTGTGACTIQSIDRSGITTPPLLRAWNGDESWTPAVGNMVYYFMAAGA